MYDDRRPEFLIVFQQKKKKIKFANKEFCK